MPEPDRRSTAGSPNAALLAVLYDQLRLVAAGCMRSERVEHTLQPTALVNEVYLKLMKTPVASTIPKPEFVALASHAMRQVLVDHARGRQALKRGGGWDRISINTNLGGTDDSSDIDLIALDEALRKLASQDERTGRVVELRYFGGLTIAETAESLGVSHGTVEADWAFGRAWLKQRLEGGGA
jgi:RNA polymerase sigma-70 factor (ECF subfamily)